MMDLAMHQVTVGTLYKDILTSTIAHPHQNSLLSILRPHRYRVILQHIHFVQPNHVSTASDYQDKNAITTTQLITTLAFLFGQNVIKYLLHVGKGFILTIN